MNLPSWVGNNTNLKESTTTTTADGIVTTVDVTYGKLGSLSAPAIGGEIYSVVLSNNGMGRGISTLTVKKSNRFQDRFSKWSLDYGVTNIVCGVSKNIMVTPTTSIGGSTPLISTFPGVFLHKPVLCPVVTKISYYITQPAISGVGPGAPSGAPFIIIIPSIPSVLADFYPDPPVFGWMKTSDSPSLTTDGWQRTESWRYMIVSGSG